MHDEGDHRPEEGEYIGKVDEEISGIFRNQAVQQIDVAFDVYHRQSRKRQMRN